MTARIVRRIAPKINTGEIQNGVNVSARTWAAMADIVNYLAGRGSTQVPAYYPGNTITAGSSVNYECRIGGTAATLTRLWFVRARSASSTQSTELTATVGSSAATAPFSSLRSNAPLVLIEDVATPAAEGSVTLALAATSGLANAEVDSIACYDIPRLSLDSTANKSVNPDSFVPRTPIYDDGASSGNSTESIQGIIDSLRYFQNTSQMPHPRRNHWQWAVPTADALTVTGGSYATIIDNIHYLPKRITSGASSTSIKFWVYAKVDSGSAALKFRSSSIDLTTVSVTSTSGAWVNVSYPIGVQEDLDEDDGRATVSSVPVWSALNIQARVTTATQLDIQSVAFMDDN